MSFKVDVAALAGLPAQLDRLGGDAAAAQQYVAKYTRLAYGGGLLNRIAGGHEHATRTVRGYLGQLAEPVAGNTAEAVRVAIAYYRSTDANAAARLDATFPSTSPGGRIGGTPGPGLPSGTAFSDVARPRDRYQPPPDRSEEFSFEPKPLAAISAAAFGRLVIVEATTLASRLGLGRPWDPYAEILKPVSGDWNGLRGCADVYENLALALEGVSANARNAAWSVGTVWQGHAAEGAVGHLLRIAVALQAAHGPLVELAKTYETAAAGAFELFGTLGDVLNQLIDAVVIFIAEASAAAATSETIVGGLAFGAAAAWEAYRCYELIKTAIEVVTLAEAASEACASSLNGFGVVDGDVALPALEVGRPLLPGNQAAVGQPSLRAAAAGTTDGGAPAGAPDPVATTPVPVTPQPIRPPDPTGSTDADRPSTQDGQPLAPSPSPAPRPRTR